MRRYLFLVVGLVGAFTAAVTAFAAGRTGRMKTPPSAAGLIATIDRASAGDGGLAELVKTVPPHSPLREVLESKDLEAARAMLAFRPLDEAPIPEGFPAFTPVGLIEVKRYPAYRRASGKNFWTLFQHIQTQGIPMTAPVEMGARTSPRGDGAMAFLYQNTKVGEPGPIDGIEVEDAAAETVVSLGVRGNAKRELIADARRRLEAWLADQSEYTVAGGDETFRVFGYNSPMVSSTQRYWEAQIRIVPAAKKEEVSAANGAAPATNVPENESATSLP